MHECPDCYEGCYCGGDIDDCADQRHRWGKESPIFKGQRMCRCGAVEGEKEN